MFGAMDVVGGACVVVETGIVVGVDDAIEDDELEGADVVVEFSSP